MSDDLEVKENLKRTHDESNGPASKRAHISDKDDDDTVQVKVLIPSAAVGAIIGKGGETMRNLKNDSKCRVQMSKNQEVYPGTNERICLVKGKVSHAMIVIESLAEKIRDKVEGVTRDPFDHKDTPRAQEIKLLMPNTSAGMVIGKSGASIKEIRDGCGCQIQVFPKSGSVEAKNSVERVVTVAHEDVSKLMEAVQRVLEKVAADPMHAQPVDSKDHENFGIGPPTGNTGGFGSSNQNAGGFGGNQNFGGNKFNGTGNTMQFNPMQGLGNNELLQFLDSLQSTLRTSGFNEAAVAEVMQAMQILAKYNIMGLGLGLGVAAMAQMRSGNESSNYGMQQSQFGSTQNLDNSFSSGMGGTGTNAGGQCWGYSASQLGQQQQQQPQNQQQTTTLGRLNNVDAGGFASTVMVERFASTEGNTELEVPDAVVGAILGPKARTLVEIQQKTGCKVVVHRSGDGDSDVSEGKRLVSLTGDRDQMKNARKLIEKIINDFQQRRKEVQH
ncbi:unnamed protein product, partial [Mesorhabditis belari]|uniref:K Homology domain-containing protein n=1 Tax=Mesorhabditis belari TaxID=2138241 RepID=A0AAF3J9J8_9BILA